MRPSQEEVVESPTKYGGQELEEGFKASRLIQDYMIEEAQKLGIHIVSNVNNRGKLLEQF